MSICVLLSVTASERASVLSVELFGRQLSFRFADWFVFHSFLLEFRYLFMKTDEVGRDTPAVSCSILAEEKIKAAVCEDRLCSKPVCVVYRWILCMTLDYF